MKYILGFVIVGLISATIVVRISPGLSTGAQGVMFIVGAGIGLLLGVATEIQRTTD